MESSSQKPVQVGDILDLECIGIGKKGDGVFKTEGFVIMAKGARIGGIYRLKITRICPKVGFAEMI